jgi:CubicO group peptidase (beta-lactamase class C family)
MIGRRTLVLGLAASAAATPLRAAAASRIEGQIETLRNRSHIPSISAVIARGQAVEWARGFGSSDLGGGKPATENTVYHLASLTKPFAATLVQKLAEEGKVVLDDPVSRYGVRMENADQVKVRHLLSHTSEGEPGSHYNYNGNRFSALDVVIRQAAGKPFAEVLQERIIVPLGLGRTAPNPQSPSFAVSGKDRAAYEAQMAVGYSWLKGKQEPTAYPSGFNTAAGLTASATDMAAFSMAMDRDALLSPEWKAQAYRPTVGPKGEVFPYGLGWFVSRYHGQPIIWHYGLWTAISSLIIKAPDKGLTFVLLADSDALSAPYQLGAGKLESSPWARAFLESYVA